ncbi:MAG: DUF5082 domain-containing protein [Clostridium sp.]|nr:DUF5082 domain-containing protein [Clostridium sp.]
MDKWVLRNKIRNYEGMIAENKQEIYVLECKLEKINGVKPKLTEIQEQISDNYIAKRNKFDAYLAIARGRAIKSLLSKGFEMYSNTNCDTQINRLDNIIFFINENISKIEEMIAEKKWENNHYYSAIKDCEWKIDEIERKERIKENV